MAHAALVAALALAAIACSEGDSSEVDDTSTSSPSTTAPDVVVLEDVVGLGLDGIYAADGTALLVYTQAERDCISVAGIGGTGLDRVAGPGATTDDPDLEQATAEAALGCLGFARVAPLVTQQLAADEALTGIDPACLDREVASLQDTPDILAAVLRGEPDTISVVASTASINCT